MARLSRMTRFWGRAVHSACAASRRLGRARCPRPPAPPPGQARRPGPSALSRARPRAPSDPNFVPVPLGWVCWAIGARVGARDEAQRTPTDPRKRRGTGERDRAASRRRPLRGDLADTLCQCCCSRSAFGAHLGRFLERDRGAVWASTAFPTIASPGLFFCACHLWQKSSGLHPRAKFHVAAHRRPPHPPRRKTGFGAFSAPDQLTDTTGRVSRFLRPRTFVPSLHTSYLTWNRRQILRPHRAVLFSQWWLLGASPSLT